MFSFIEELKMMLKMSKSQEFKEDQKKLNVFLKAISQALVEFDRNAHQELSCVLLDIYLPEFPNVMIFSFKSFKHNLKSIN